MSLGARISIYIYREAERDGETRERADETETGGEQRKQRNFRAVAQQVRCIPLSLSRERQSCTFSRYKLGRENQSHVKLLSSFSASLAYLFRPNSLSPSLLGCSETTRRITMSSFLRALSPSLSRPLVIPVYAQPEQGIFQTMSTVIICLDGCFA